MEVKAKLHDITFGADGKERLTFTLDQRVDASDLQDKDLRLKAVKWTEKRSLNANAYFHLLAGKIADATGQSHTEVHNQLIADYGQLEIIDNHLMPVIFRDDINWRKLETLHVRPTANKKVLEDGNVYTVYLVMRGSHTYDSKEMSILLNGTISDAQEQGIETITPDEKARMLQQWQVRAS